MRGETSGDDGDREATRVARAATQQLSRSRGGTSNAEQARKAGADARDGRRLRGRDGGKGEGGLSEGVVGGECDDSGDALGDSGGMHSGRGGEDNGRGDGDNRHAVVTRAEVELVVTMHAAATRAELEATHEAVARAAAMWEVAMETLADGGESSARGGDGVGVGGG